MVNKLVEGIRKFKQDTVADREAFFAELANGQSPPTLFITCADSRVDPSLITQTEPGEVFVVRNAGNIVPSLDASGSSPDGNAASIEYAVSVLNVTDIIVCGHSSCGAMGALRDLDTVAELPSVARWLEHSHALLDSPDGVNDLPLLIERNVLLQLEHLSTYPSIKAGLDDGSITLHGWVYDVGTGSVVAHDGTSFKDVLQ